MNVLQDTSTDILTKPAIASFVTRIEETGASSIVGAHFTDAHSQQEKDYVKTDDVLQVKRPCKFIFFFIFHLFLFSLLQYNT